MRMHGMDTIHGGIVLRRFTLLLGMLPVVVHGGGKAISREMKERGIEPRFVKGLRVTCERSIEVVERVPSGFGGG